MITRDDDGIYIYYMYNEMIRGKNTVFAIGILNINI